MHVLVPIRAGPDADEVLAFADSFVTRMAAAQPDELTVEHSITARWATSTSIYSGTVLVKPWWPILQ